MPKVRIGLSTDFNLINEQVGIGTTNPTARLEVAGSILADSSTVRNNGISSFREYQGFLQSQSGINQNVSIDSSDSGELNSLSGEIKITGNVTVTPESKITSGRLSNLTVTERFAVPLGNTNDRDITPEAGTTRFNQDTGSLEFFDGYSWKSVNATSRSGRVVIAGGYGPLGVPGGNPGVKSMQKMQTMTLGSAQYFGELDQVNTEHIGCGSETRGLLGGGYVSPQRVDIIQYVTLAGGGGSLDFGNLTIARNQAQAVSSSTRGIWAGGHQSSLQTRIDYVNIASTGDAEIFGDLAKAASPGAVANSPTRGVFIAGYRQPTSFAFTETTYITIESKGNSVDFGESDIIIAGGSCGSSTRGVFGGGYHRNPSTVATRNLGYITMATLGNAVYFGELTKDMTYASAGGTSTRGIFTGSDGSPYSNTNMDYVSVTSLGNALDFGDLAVKTGYAGAVSDSHGGLGGF